MSVRARLQEAGRRLTRRNSARLQDLPRRPWRLHIEMLETRVVPTLAGNQLFPDDNPWNHPITDAPVAASSAAMIDAIYGSLIPLHPDFGTVYHGSLNGIPYNVVSGTQPKVQVVVDAYASESDIQPIPIPADAVIEGDTPTGPSLSNTSDRHLIVYDADANIAYEAFGAYRPGETLPDGQVDPNYWHVASEAVWDLNENTFRTAGYTSADAAGLTILPGLVRADEVFDQGEINHALRFTAHMTSNAYVFPGSHHTYLDPVQPDPLHPRMGERFRLKSSVDITQLPGYSLPGYQQDVVILEALKKYGMIVADNGNTGFISGAPSPLWNDDILHLLGYVPMSDFEVVDLTPVVSALDTTAGSAGTSVTISGLNFAGTAGTTQVFFGTTPAASIDIVSDTQIVAVAPAGTGQVNVTVQSGYGTSTALVPFTYPTFPGVPAAPTAVTATSGVGNVTVNWSAVNGATSYNLYRGTSPGSEGSGVYLGAITGTSISDIYGYPGYVYYYQVTAVNSTGESDPSAEVSGQYVPLAPMGVTATSGAGNVTVSWSAVNGATSYNLYRGTSPGSEGLGVYLGGITGTSISDIYGYPGYVYYYQVTAVNTGGESDPSAEVSGQYLG
jgi:hypothetical protein